jgi:RNA polymerase sigma factor (sigma-70 family)
MPDEILRLDSPSDRQSWFATTHWSVLLAARDVDSPAGSEALEKLCGAYWQPLYSYIRRLGHSPADAEDLTQAFLANLLAHGSFKRLSPRKGRFRTFLLASLKHFLADVWDKQRAQKRGGQVKVISLDAREAEDRYALEPEDTNDPGKIFERRWALTLLERTLGRLERETQEAGKGELWSRFKVYLLGEAEAPCYRELSEQLGLSVSAVKMSVARLRRRFGELLRVEIAQTVSNEGEVEEEMRYLLRVVKG